MDRPKHMHKSMWPRYVKACFQAGVDPDRVTQTQGSAPASAGTHGRDGFFTNENGNQESYSAALDLSVKNSRLTKAQREALLIALWENGFCAWYRQAPEFPGNEHIHCVAASLIMKRSLRNQVHDFLAHRSGLVSDKSDAFVCQNLTEATEQKLRTEFLQSGNPITG